MMQPKRTLYTEETVMLTLTLTMDHLCSDCNFFRILLTICNLKLITNNLIKDKCSVPWKPLCSAKFKESFPGWPFYNDKVSVQFSAKLSPLRNSAIFDNKKIICTWGPIAVKLAVTWLHKTVAFWRLLDGNTLSRRTGHDLQIIIEFTLGVLLSF